MTSQCKLDLVFEQIINRLALSDQVVFAFMNQYLARTESRVVVTGHGKAIRAGVFKTQQISWMNFVHNAVGRKCIGLTDVSDNVVYTRLAGWTAEIKDMMI